MKGIGVFLAFAFWLASATAAFPQSPGDNDVSEPGVKRAPKEAEEIIVFPEKAALPAAAAPFAGGPSLDEVLRSARDKDYASALKILEAMPPPAAGGAGARAYLHGWLLRRLDRNADALLKFEEASSDPLTGDRALLDRVELLSQDNPSAAQALLEQLFQMFPDSPVIEEALLFKAGFLRRSGLDIKAIVLIKETVSHGVKSPEKWLWLLAQCQEAAGERPEAFASYSRIYFEYPQTPLAGNALAEMDRMRKDHLAFYPLASVKEKLQRAETLMTNRLYRDAAAYIRSMDKSTFSAGHRAEIYMHLGRAMERMGNKNAALAAYAEASAFRDRKIRPEALHRMARIHWNRDENREAVVIINRILKEFATLDVSASALYMLARMDESAGDRKSALKKFDRAAAVYPSAAITEACMWFSGWLRYLDGDWAGAEAAFGRMARQYEGTSSGPMGLYWQARSLEAMGKDASELFKRIAAKYPFSYYTLLADGNGILFRFPPDPPKTSSALGEEALRNVEAGLAKYSRAPELSGKNRWAFDAAQVWMGIGFQDRAKELLGIALKGAGGGRDTQTWVAAQYYRAGCYLCVTRMADSLMQSEQDPEYRGFLARLVFPLAYWRTVEAEARANNLDPFFILSVIRQESVFDPGVISVADARGLMQIIPSTAERLAREKGDAPATEESLHAPEKNIRLGAYYLSTLVRGQGGELPLVLAEYNAGPKAVAKWKEKTPYGDVRMFVERIPYTETREYVKKVLRNYGIYRKVYLENGAGHPPVEGK